MISFLVERLFLQKLWLAWRDGIAAAVVPGSGGVAFLGDSITHGGRWDLLFPSAQTRNFGISGERSEHLLQRLDPIIKLRPKKLFILIGTNDLSKGISSDRVAKNVDELLRRIAEQITCDIYLQSVFPRSYKYAGKVCELNSRYKQIAQARHAHYLDLFSAFSDDRGQLREDLTNDGLHLVGAGYEVWRRSISQFVTD